MAKPKLLDGLNPEQRVAVTTTEGPLLVLAGAGSGKTRVITVRIAHLLAKGVAPASVLAVTFTNKAAREMRERVAGLVGEERAGELYVGTFHAFCVRRAARARRSDRPGARDFTICDASDQLAALQGRAARAARRRSRRSSRARCRRASRSLKNRLVTARRVPARGAADDARRARRARVEALRGAPARARARSTSTTCCCARVRLLRGPDEPRDALARALPLRAGRRVPGHERARSTRSCARIAGEHRNLCVVGDDDQSIYGWRGADVRTHPRASSATSPAPTVVRLETNYRSTEPILERRQPRHRATTRRATRRRCARRSARASPVRRGRVARTRRRRPTTWRARSRARAAPRQARFGDFAVLFRTADAAARVRGRSCARAASRTCSSAACRSSTARRCATCSPTCASPRTPTTRSSLLRVVNCPPRGIGRDDDRARRSRTRPRTASRSPRPSRAPARSTGCPPRGRGRARDSVRALRRLCASEAAAALSSPGRSGCSTPSATAPRSSAPTPTRATREERWAAVEEVAQLRREPRRAAASTADAARLPPGARARGRRRRDRRGARASATRSR